MKIRIDIVPELTEPELIIRCSELTEEIGLLQKQLVSYANITPQYVFYKDDTQYYLPIESILFFESGDSFVSAHTGNDVFETKYKLYELEAMLPLYFQRVSKSTILNCRRIYSIRKNLTAASLVEFANSHKKVYCSRSYYKGLINKLEKRDY